MRPHALARSGDDSQRAAGAVMSGRRHFTDHDGIYAAALDATRRRVVLEALERNEWNVRATAREIGVTRNLVHRLMQRFDLKRPAEIPRAFGNMPPRVSMAR